MVTVTISLFGWLEIAQVSQEHTGNGRISMSVSSRRNSPYGVLGEYTRYSVVVTTWMCIPH